MFTAFSPYLLLPIPRLTYCQSAGCSANLGIFDSCAFPPFTSAGEVHTRHMPIIHHVLRHPTRTRSRHSPSRPPLQRPMSRVLTLPEIMILWLVHRFGVISLVKGFPIALPCKLLLWQFIFPLISQPARCTYLGLIFKSYLRPFSSMLFWIKLLSTVIRWRCRIYDHHY